MNKLKLGITEWYKMLKNTIEEFIADNVIKLSASLAYYTIFAIGPVLMVIISLTGMFVKKDLITGKIYVQISTLIGTQGTDQIKLIIQNMQDQNTASKFGMIGVVILIFAATGVFADIQDSINYIWSVRAKPKRGWLKFLRNRLLSFSLIIGVGFLLMVSLFVNTVTDLLTDRLQQVFNIETLIIFKILNISILFCIVTILFAVIYKVLPDALIKWKDAFVGATFTGVLFLIGKFLIGYYLGNSQIGSTYGATASIIIILSWIYYTSIILYFGAEFTKVYALTKGGGIEPYGTAVFIIKREARELPNSWGKEN